MSTLPSAADYAAVTEYLFSLKPRGKNFGIDRMKLLAGELGHPEQGLSVVHIAGTNGKGSAAAMIEAILRAAGWRVGLYTSPHLVNLGERVQVDRQILTDAEIVAYAGELRPVAERIAAVNVDDQSSFFELMTAMAFLQFSRKRCDLGIIEVGLGGRLDATNIVIPEVSVITSIGLDHCELLGDTLEKIAAEKAGIIKPGIPVVIGRMPTEAERVIRATAAERGARVISVAEEFGNEVERCPRTNLEGDYQRWNAATATLIAQTLPAKWRLNSETIAAGLLRVNWSGRWQRTRVGGRLLVLDASHNSEGAQVLEINLANLAKETGCQPLVVCGALGIERAQPLIETICRHAREIHVVVPDQPRACSHAEIEALVPSNFRGRVIRATVDGLLPSADFCSAGGADDTIVVTGSIYLLGEVMARLERPGGSAAPG